MNKTLWIVIGVVVVLGIWAVSGYNKLVNYSEAVPAAWARLRPCFNDVTTLSPIWSKP